MSAGLRVVGNEVRKRKERNQKAPGLLTGASGCCGVTHWVGGTVMESCHWGS